MRRASWWRRLWQALRTQGEEEPGGSPAPGGRKADPRSRPLPDRTLVIRSFLDEERVSRVVVQLLGLESEDAEAEITLWLDSEGGSAAAVLVLHDTLTSLRPPVSVVCVGRCEGVSTLLLACGRTGRRSIVAHGVVRLSALGGHATKPDGSARHRRLMQLYQHLLGLLSLYTGRPVEQLRADCEQERSLTAHEARDYGLVDHVLPPEQ